MLTTRPDNDPYEVVREVSHRRVLNIAGYLFVELLDLERLRSMFSDAACKLGLLGTVLIAGEGINVSLAGPPVEVRDWLDIVRAQPGFSRFTVKETWSATVPFQRLKVKVKREIIRMDHPTISPTHQRANAVAPVTLKHWLDQGHDDEGRPIVMLDTRNAFEVECGTFAGAVHWDISKFTEFPKRVAARVAELAGKRVVSFCTGGIRCEKAAIFMREAGVDNVVQLDGGILQYFDDVGQAHFGGSCFVFDERISLRGNLEPTGH